MPSGALSCADVEDMRTSPVRTPVEVTRQATPPISDEVVHSLLNLINKLDRETAAEWGEAASSVERILLDAELNGFRYLLVRMPRPSRNRIQLSPREQEIVRMVAKGHPNKVIADVLSISCWTVCTHLRRIFAKLGVGSRAAMVAQLLEIGALKPDHRVSGELR